jgi:hypothetical protein
MSRNGLDLCGSGRCPLRNTLTQSYGLKFLNHLSSIIFSRTTVFSSSHTSLHGSCLRRNRLPFLPLSIPIQGLVVLRLLFQLTQIVFFFGTSQLVLSYKINNTREHISALRYKYRKYQRSFRNRSIRLSA